MYRYAALLRGITPSNPNMTNDKLRAVFEGLGLTGVRSVLASGNIVFRNDSGDEVGLEGCIEQALASTLGIPGRTIIRERAGLRALVDSDPFGGLTHGPSTYLTVTFLQDRARPEAQAATAPARVREYVVGFDPTVRAVLMAHDNTDPRQSSALMGWLEKAYGKDITTRSFLSVQRILARLES